MAYPTRIFRRKQMRSIRLLSLIVASLVVTNPGQAMSDVSVGVSISDGELKGFYLAVGDFYEAPHKEVIALKGKNIPDDEIPVVYFLARRAHVAPAAIIKLRLGGSSWMEISLHFGLAADIYHVSVEGSHGPPYGKALGHFKKHKKKDWHTIRLSDRDIVNLVNLQFVSAHYGYSPDEVIKQRGSGKSFIRIGHEIEKRRTLSKAPAERKKKFGRGKSPSKGKKKSDR